MKQVLVVSGQVCVTEVPAPRVEPGTVLVQVDHSCISAGTEVSGISTAATPLWKRALKDPAKVRTALQLVAHQGLAHGRRVIAGQLSAATPIGYSAAGVVLAVGEGLDDVEVGDRVACAGAGVANHAEVVRVPRNLVVPVPDDVPLADASTVTLGAIALQGVRRAEPTLGETFVVVGLGILGQLTVQLLKANGCRVVVTDLDASRTELARELGADAAATADDGGLDEQVYRLTGGIGADGVIITASTPSDAVVSTAFRMCRKKGRVVLVGDVGLALDRADFYAKELDFRISTSYGPGRYDRRYEQEGADYPIGYVRWTENRNMDEFLRLMAAGQVRVAPLVAAVHPIDEAPQAYSALSSGAQQQPVVLLHYPDRGEEQRAPRRVPTRSAPARHDGVVRLALIGAGGFARTAHLPNLAALEKLGRLHAVVSRTGSVAADVARQYGGAWSSTDPAEVFGDPDVDAVLIATRHDSHGELVLAALDAGKAVLVEKPLALTAAEVDAVEAWYAARPEGPVPVLLTGYNRRFSPAAVRLRALTADRRAPMVLSYRMNAGYLPGDHWVHGPQGGGRNRGEACHVYDLFTFLTGAAVETVSAEAIAPQAGYRSDDNFAMTARFADGSIASLAYTALGSGEHPKEQLEVFSDGRVLVLDNYEALHVVGSAREGVAAGAQDKGHRLELEAFLRAVRGGGAWPISLTDQLQAARIALDVERRIRPDAAARPAG